MPPAAPGRVSDATNVFVEAFSGTPLSLLLLKRASQEASVSHPTLYKKIIYMIDSCSLNTERAKIYGRRLSPRLSASE